MYEGCTKLSTRVFLSVVHILLTTIGHYQEHVCSGVVCKIKKNCHIIKEFLIGHVHHMLVTSCVNGLNLSAGINI